jgi:hypothetical protein
MTMTCLPSGAGWPLTLSPALTLFWLGKTPLQSARHQVAARHGQVTRLLSATGQDNPSKSFAAVQG